MPSTAARLTATTRSGSIPPSLWAPLRVGAFRALWFAQLTSMLGTWMQTVGAQWLLVAQSGSAALVALAQVAAILPMQLFALPAGALADIMGSSLLALSPAQPQLGDARHQRLGWSA